MILTRQAHIYLSLSLCTLSTLAMQSAHAIILREAELLSYLGAPVDIRVAVKPGTGETLDLSCFSLAGPKSSSEQLTSNDVNLQLSDLNGQSYLHIRGKRPHNEPIVQFRLQSACGGSNGFFRDYTLLPDPHIPAPRITLPANSLTDAVTSPLATATSAAISSSALASASGTPAANAPSRVSLASREGDTLSSLAKDVYPRSRRMREAFIVQLRRLNPELVEHSIDQALAPSKNLYLPDLRDLANANLGTTPSSPSSAARTARRSPANQILGDMTAPSSSESLPAAVEKKTEVESAPAIEKRKNLRPRSGSTATRTAKSGNGSFQLKLSSAEVDLSLSQTISDEERASLREKQMLLDADDQVATLLSLKNNVRQLENRLNALQLKLSGLPDVIPAGATPSANATGTGTTDPIAPSVNAGDTPAAQTAALPTAATLAPPPVTPKAAAVTADSKGFGWSSSMLAALAAAIVALLGGIFWWRRQSRPATSSLRLDFPGTRVEPDAQPEARHAQPRPTLLEPTVLADTPKATPAPAEAESALSLKAAMAKIKARQPVEKANSEVNIPASLRANKVDIDIGSDDSTLDLPDISLDLPRSIDAALASSAPTSDNGITFDLDKIELETPDNFDLELKPSGRPDTSLDTSKTQDDRIRRRTFMSERYPELGAGIISLDATETVINAARIYLQDDEAEKAQELLGFALEERPQKTALWLALFEIYRRQGLAREYGQLAAKFHVLFSDSPEWKKICILGHRLDDHNPQFLKHGRTASVEDANALLAQENWLGEDGQGQKEELGREFRAGLLTEHNIPESAQMVAEASDLPQIAVQLMGRKDGQ